MGNIEVTPELLANLKEKAGKATKGNWFSTCDNLLQPVVNCVALDRYESRIATFEDSPYSEKDADFIASANPAVMLALIAKIEQLEKEADWLSLALSKRGGSLDPFCCPPNKPYEPIIECVAEHGSCADCWRNAAKEAKK